MDNNHLETMEGILQELEASDTDQDQTDGDTQADTDDLRHQMSAVSAEKPQVSANAIIWCVQMEDKAKPCPQKTVFSLFDSNVLCSFCHRSS